MFCEMLNMVGLWLAYLVNKRQTLNFLVKKPYCSFCTSLNSIMIKVVVLCTKGHWSTIPLYKYLLLCVLLCTQGLRNVLECLTHALFHEESTEICPISKNILVERYTSMWNYYLRNIYYNLQRIICICEESL